MKTLLLALSLFPAVIFAAIESAEELTESDVQALREWVNTKRQVTVKELGGALSISGEVRTEFQTSAETVSGIRQRGGPDNSQASRAWDVKFSLMFDYRTDRTWVASRLKFNNDAGLEGGTSNKINLDRAYWGVRFCETDTTTFDMEMGRRKLRDVYDSKIEFGALYDGIAFKYDRSIEKLGDFYIHLGSYLINEKKDQYGYVGETGLLDIRDSGAFVKLSLNDWYTKHFHNSIYNERFRFIIGQLLIGHDFTPKCWKKKVRLYLAALYNFAARGIALTDHRKANLGGYTGFTIGRLEKAGSWAFDANYQVVQAQAIPDYDVNGIGIGNAADTGFYTAKANGTGAATTNKTAQGNVNWRGYVLTLDYLFTNNLGLQQKWQQSQTLDADIGPYRRFQQYEAQFFYVF